MAINVIFCQNSCHVHVYSHLFRFIGAPHFVEGDWRLEISVWQGDLKSVKTTTPCLHTQMHQTVNFVHVKRMQIFLLCIRFITALFDSLAETFNLSLFYKFQHSVQCAEMQYSVCHRSCMLQSCTHSVAAYIESIVSKH